MALSQKEINALLKEAASLKQQAKDILDKESQGNADIALQVRNTNKEYKSKISLLKQINREIVDARESQKKIVESYVEQQEKLQDLSGLQERLKDTETRRINIMAAMPNLQENIRETIVSISELQRDLIGTTSEQNLKQGLIRQQLDAHYQSLEGSRGVHSQLRNLMLEQRSIAEDVANLSEDERKQLELQNEWIDKIKDSMGGILSVMETLTSGPMGMLGSGLIAAGFGMEKLGKVANETGTFLSEISISATGLSFIFEDAVSVAKSLAKELGGVENATFKTQLQANLLANTLNISGEEVSSLIGSFSRLNGNSTEIATSTLQATKYLAKANGVIPAQIMEDLAASTEEFALYGKEGGANIANAAIFAAKLGVSMSQISGITDNLLDFETSITKELELGALLGRNINLNKARQLAYDGNIGAATKETLRQLGGIAEFNRMDPIMKKQSADLLGVSVAEMQKMINNMDKLNDNGTIQLTQTEMIGQKFDYVSDIMRGIATGPGGDFLKMLGGGAIAMGQMGFPLKGIVKDTAQVAKNIGKWIAAKTAGIFGGAAGTAASIDVAELNEKPKIITDSVGKINMSAVLKGAAAMVIVAGAVFVFGKAVQEFMKVSWESVGMAVVSMLALVGAVALLGLLLSGPQELLIIAGAAAMLIVAGAVYVLGKAIQEMAIGFEQMGMISGILLGLVALIVPMGSLTIALAQLAGSLMFLGIAGLVALPAIFGLSILTKSIVMVSGAIGSMVGIGDKIDTLAQSFMGLAGSLLAVGTAGLIALPSLLGLSVASKGLGMVADVLGIKSSSETASGIEDGSLSEYQTKMLEKMDKLISATMLTRDIYLDKEKVTNVVMRSSERRTENIFGLGVA